MDATHQRILGEYRNADLNRRLHMYLQMPRLRAEFIEIDRRDSPFQFPGSRSKRGHSPAAALCELLGRLRSLGQRLFKPRQAGDFLGS